jgi:hypothetical protein
MYGTGNSHMSLLEAATNVL